MLQNDNDFHSKIPKCLIVSAAWTVKPLNETSKNTEAVRTGTSPNAFRMRSPQNPWAQVNFFWWGGGKFQVKK